MILDRIVANKRREIAEARLRVPREEMKLRAAAAPPTLDFAAVLAGPGVKLIAEVKKASPSRGVIRAAFDPAAVARVYAANGAAAISVLTDERYFQGRLSYLKDVKVALAKKPVPVLRKDFIVDAYQVYESRAAGADAILLIVAALAPTHLHELMRLSGTLGMQCLVEAHDEAELDMALRAHAHIIGINNRDLKTMEVDIGTTERLKPLVPPGHIVVSESGIRDRRDVLRMQRLRVDAVLVGEALMASGDVANKMRELLGQG